MSIHVFPLFLQQRGSTAQQLLDVCIGHFLCLVFQLVFSVIMGNHFCLKMYINTYLVVGLLLHELYPTIPQETAR